MNLTHTWTRGLVAGAAVTVALLAMAGCCKDKKDEEADIPPLEPIVVAQENPVPTAAPDPEWKMKCPEADRPESGTITVTRTLNIYKSPAATSERLSSISPSTWANLLGASGT